MSVAPLIPAPLLNSLSQRLDARAQVLRDEVAAARAAVRALEADRGADVVDRKEAADDEVLAGIGEAEVDRDLQELRAIEAARQRIADGRYGRCDDCAQPIDLQRLQVQPAAIRCAACQAASEARRRP